MGFLSDFTKGYKKTKKAVDKVTAQPAAKRVPLTKPATGSGFDWAVPEDYDPIPPLALRKWGEFKGKKAGRGGYGFEFPDGRWLYPDRLGIRRWKSVGVFYVELAGGQFHAEDLTDPSFDPGQPLLLEAEPDNPYSEDGTAIAVRNWANDRTAGYVPSELTGKVRKLTSGTPFHTLALCARYEPKDGKIARVFTDFVIFRPGRISGLGDFPVNPPIADPPSP